MSNLVLVVPAAGRGTRLGDLAREIPKGMVPVGGKPILENVLATGAQLPLDRIVLIIGHRGEVISDYFGASFRGVPITYVVQEEPRGLTRAVALAEPFVDDRMLVLLSDEVYVKGRHVELHRRALDEDPDGIVGFVRTTDAERIRRNYAIELNGEARISRLLEKPKEIWNELQGTGTWMFKREYFDFVPRTPLHPVRGEPDFVAVIQEMIDAGRTVLGMEVADAYLNVNDGDDLLAARSIVEGRIHTGAASPDSAA